jgi:Ulp1 family protease
MQVPKIVAQSTNDGTETVVLEDGHRQNGFMEGEMPTTQLLKRPLTGSFRIESSRESSCFSSQSHDEAETSVTLQKNDRSTFPNKKRSGTRSSDRLQSFDSGFDLGFDQHTLNTSFQLGWTRQNPGWQAERGWTSSLVYPAEGPKKATVDSVDIDRLDEGGYLNDNLIEFYLLYLEHNLEKNRPEIAKRIYFQNTFFYKTLTKGKTRGSNINYDAVKRWTAKVDLFSFDYIIVPVCEKAHWYVAIICNTPKLLQNNAEENAELEIEEVVDKMNPTLPIETQVNLETSTRLVTEIGSPESEQLVNRAKPRSRSPSVTAKVENLSLEEDVDDNEWTGQGERPENLSVQDSIAPDGLPSESPIFKMRRTLSPSGMVANSFKGRRGKRKSIPPSRTYDPNQPRIITLDSLGGSHSPTCSNLQKYLVCEAMAKRQVDISVERLGMTAKGLPQQDNYCDCGIFVLGYIEEFLRDPDSFVHDILLGKMTTAKGWAKMNAPEMRSSIRGLLFKLHDEQSRREKELRTTKPKVKRPSRTEKIGNLDLSTDNRKNVASRAPSIPRTPTVLSLVPKDTGAVEPDVEAEVERDRNNTGQKKTRPAKRTSTASPNVVVEASPVDNWLPLEQIKAKRPRSNAEEPKSPQGSAEDRVTRIKKFGFESGRTKISNIPSSRETSPLIPLLELQHSSPRLETPFKPSGMRPKVSESPTPEYPTNPFKQYARRKSPSTDRKSVRVSQQTSIFQEAHSEIENSFDGISDPPPRNIHRIDSLEDITDSPKISSKKIRTEESFKDTQAGPISPTLVNSTRSASMLYSSPKTPTRTSPRITRTSPRILPARKLIGQDLAGQYLSRQERQAQGTWVPKRRAPG